jgi:rfaE bifunctional protein nucleotidyltransferase chain/domain
MITSKKIFEFDNLVQELEQIRSKNEKIVLCHGCFDLLHVGHIRHFHQAKGFGDKLVVTLTPDRFVDKGPDRPAFSEKLRAEAIASLHIVDYVAINKWPTAVDTIRALKPDIYAKGSEFKSEGSDYTGKIDMEIEALKETGGQIMFTEDIVFSSSNLINRFLSNKSEEVDEYLRLFRNRYHTETIHDLLNNMESLRVLVLGDIILDDYHYCNTIGKSNKDPVLAVHYQSSDLFAGGVLAVANQIADFAGDVRLLTILGERDSHEDFIKENLNPRVKLNFVTNIGAPTIVKRRFLDGNTFVKLLEVYIMGETTLHEEIDRQLCERLEKEMKDVDLVVAADFGHGAITPRMIRLAAEKAPFLAVNTQANAGNRGFHVISRYPRADFVCLAEHEIRLEKRETNGRLRPLMDETARKLSSKYFVVTRGRQGALVRGTNGTFVASPSLTSNVVDRIGAGDAFFAITSMAAVLGADEELIGFIGNVIGSRAVGIIGNKKSFDRLEIKKAVTALLK